MIDPFDYKEPRCATCGGKDFYYPNVSQPDGYIPVDRVIEKLDALYEKNLTADAGRLLEYWLGEAVYLKDKRGELAVQSEMMGHYRKQNAEKQAVAAAERGLALIGELGLDGTLSAATVTLNAATVFKAFGNPRRALELYNETERIYLARLDPNDERLGGLFNNKALAYEDIGEPQKAVNYYQKALGIVEKLSHGQADAAITYINLAHLYDKFTEDDEKTDALMKKAWELLQSPQLPRNGYYAFVCTKCAPSFGYFGFFVEDGELKKRAKEIYERA